MLQHWSPKTSNTFHVTQPNAASASLAVCEVPSAGGDYSSEHIFVNSLPFPSIGQVGVPSWHGVRVDEHDGDERQFT